MGAPAQSVPLAAGAVAGVRAGACFRGLVVRDTAGAVGDVQIYDGTDATGTLIGAASVVADGAADTWYDGGGIRVGTGLFVVLTGTLEGSVRVG